MKLKAQIVFTALSLALASGANAAHLWEDPADWWGSHWRTYENAPKFSANELSLDLFGSYIAPQDGIENLFETDITHGKWGGGVGLNYFFLREVGLSADINIADNGGNLVDLISGSLVVRLPWEAAGLAPYVFGGGGRATEPVWEWFGHAGVGVEFRFNPYTGLFVDSRYIWADETYDRILFRGGLRWVF